MRKNASVFASGDLKYVLHRENMEIEELEQKSTDLTRHDSLFLITLP